MIAKRYHVGLVVAIRYLYGEEAMETTANTERFFVRLPPELKLWLVKQAKKNASSQNSEIVRAIRERAERVAAGQAA